MEKPCCRTCAYAGKLRDGRRTLLVCTNCPGRLGLLTRVPPEGSCRGFRLRPKRAGRHPRSRPTPDEVRYITLTKNRFALVDARDYKQLSRYKWSACLCSRQYYVRRNDKTRGIWMHREIMQPPKGMVVDHIYANGMNNCRCNLRVCTPLENSHNMRPRGMTSKFKGVAYIREIKTWEASITINKRGLHIGYFRTELEAARAYDREAFRRFGEFAYLNFPEEIKRIHAKQKRRRRVKA